MQVTFTQDDLAPLVERVVRQVLLQQAGVNAKISDRLGYTEQQAAEAIGIERHVLRDARLRGEIQAKRVGKKYVYSAEALRRFLEPH